MTDQQMGANPPGGDRPAPGHPQSPGGTPPPPPPGYGPPPASPPPPGYGPPPGSTPPPGYGPPPQAGPAAPWPGGTPTPPRRRRTGLIVGSIVGGVVVIAAVVIGLVVLLSPGTIDQAKVQSRIAEITQQQFGATPTDIRCPSDVAIESGSSFKCDAQLDGQPIKYTVKQTDDKGTVKITSDSRIVKPGELEDAVAKQAADDYGVSSAVGACDLGDRKVIVAPTKTPIPCTVANVDDPTDTLDVDASIDADGKVTYEPAS